MSKEDAFTDHYSDAASEAPELADRERAARALFVRRGYREEFWGADRSFGLRRDCRYLAEAVIDALSARAT